MSGKTMIEKILSKHAGIDARAGDIVICEVDAVMGTDGSTPMAIDYFHEMQGHKVLNPEKVVFFADHYSPAPNQKTAELHQKMKRFSEQHGCQYYPTGEGIGNQVMMEKGFVHPGDIVLGADSHSCTFGALNAFACGIGSSDLAIIMISGKIWLKVPETIKVEIIGKMPSDLTAKDIAIALTREIGADGASYQTIEFHGNVIEEMTMESRFVLSNIVAEMGAKGGLMRADQTTYQWLSKRGIEHGESVDSDLDASYSRVVTLDVSKLSPQVALPHAVDYSVPIEEIQETKVDMVFIGTCTNGRMEDFREVAEILRDQELAPGVQLLIIPASREVFLQAMEEGLIQLFMQKGATIGTPGCGPCCGTGNGVPANGENIVSTANRNFIGRMGNPLANIYLASPAVAITAAIKGKIAHPREVGGSHEVRG
ncbi:3-isopropylmalate dehydratase large subunit [Ammoniphilus sp. CFH 90114]|uniref:3-isopropylmalate dehydratase large subunit n=1 Tax=Ammoniphilus sp. CFH 90114 TaxID=2493665 RepID=UPI00100E3B3E|nr:3-isopropylmalate dehydratase large subunit [Ammoniphilus sp. CFH 90114]RXT00619.1 3-isopropylmalate dehydratase large subunit [Ammoniphilus sp. CFH 90114]